MTSVNLITTLTQRRFGNGDLSITVIYRCWNKVGFGLTLRTILFWCHDAGKIKIFILNVEKIAVFERRNNVSLSTLKFNVEATWILGCHSKLLYLCHDAQEITIFILTWKRSVFSTSKQYHFINVKSTSKFTLKQHWFWVCSYVTMIEKW